MESANGRFWCGVIAWQPHVPDEQAFIDEVTAKMASQRAEMQAGMGRAGDNIRDYMAS